MQLLPIIVVVSLLGFFIILTLIALALHCFTSNRRRRAMVNRIESRRPTKQMAIQGGKVISINRSCEASTANFLSLDLESLGSGPQTPQGEKAPRTPKPVFSRKSQEPSKSEVNEESLRMLGQQLRLSSKVTESRGMFAQQRASIVDTVKEDDHGASDNGIECIRPPATAYVETDPVSPLTKNTRTSSAPAGGRTSRLSTRSFRESIYNPKKNSRSFKLELKDLNSRPTSWDLSFEALTKSVTRPISKLVAERDQLKAPDDSDDDDDDPNRTSFFSNSPSSSIASQPITPLRSISSPSPMERGPYDRNTDSRLSARSSQPTDPFPKASLKRQSSFNDSASVCGSLRDTPDLHRVFSVMSNDSALTFAASDISSTFSLGNARSMPISHSNAVLRSPMTPTTPLTPVPPASRYSQRKSASSARSKRFPVLPSINTTL